MVWLRGMAGGCLKPGALGQITGFCVVCNVSTQFQHLCGHVPVPSRPEEDRCPDPARTCSQLCDWWCWSVAFVAEPAQEPLPGPLVICHMRTTWEGKQHAQLFGPMKMACVCGTARNLRPKPSSTSQTRARASISAFRPNICIQSTQECRYQPEFASRAIGHNNSI